ncbi:outer membrane beta-barrel family protein [Polaribacter dokdonensis]|uniref:Outer membrane receptor proteins, mostly Fe transport n=1 Tax=Polaribacter dokdonensis DSW-5 TaxID=1300348 RepID=A0A0M9CHK2_9FLAO|nr:outer membrane beta-barrel family protein [Polaribacter dokdonensis]KOY52771.1 TonB dependent/ligand-gated channel [Polaribacter dokdonensis DSW-5]SEE52052.1 Outer membrane receptor proteins, mostly Fe transport [Polaribacter dokdonensis DSW-5]
MTKRIALLLCLLLSANHFFAQDKTSLDEIKITGKVIEAESNMALEYATIVLKNTKTNAISGGITDMEGKFSISAPKATYEISVKFISFNSKTFPAKTITSDLDLGVIKLSENSKALDEVVIVAEKTTVDIRLDKKVFNIGKDLSIRGGNASDVLGNVPSVQVDVEGTVSLRGNENVTILIDGRPSALVGLNGAEALRQIPAEAIEKVEVITSPSARYDAEGTAGILNIILRKNKLTGFNGSLQLDLGYPERVGAAFNANWRTEKWNLFTNTGFRYNETPGNSLSESNFLTSTAQNARVIEQRNFGRLGRSLFTSFGAEYYLTKSSSIIGNIVFNSGNDDDVNTNDIQRLDANGGLNEATFRTESEGEDEQRIQYTLDYVNNFDQKGRKLSVNLQYSTEMEDILNNITEIDTQTSLLNDLEQVIEDQNENRALLQIDYVHPVGENIQYEAGYRGNYRDIFNSFYLAERQVFPDGPLVPDAGLNNSFNYEEFVNAAYFQYGQKFNNISLLAGLRYEYTSIEIEQQTSTTVDARSYGNLFPTINLGYEFKDGENITIGYNRRIRRPRGRNLNPFPSRSSEANIYTGNVGLNPVITDAVDLGYLKRWDKFTLSTSLYYNISNDNWERIQEDTGEVTDNGDPITRRFPINLSTAERLGFEFTLNYRPFKIWNINSDFNLFRVTTDGDYTNPTTNATQSFDFENTSYFIRLNQKITLGKTDLQINSNYRGPSQNAQTTSEGVFSMNIAASRDFFNEKASLSVNFSDVFNSRISRRTTNIPGFLDQYSEFQWREPQFRVSLVYRFNQKKKRFGGDRDDNGGDDFEE